ncbi:MAG: hypothetical protein HUJ25_16405 [Crocinitomicaceae bacterium]|nr:hypothetical protein [Crocinitomicaceae bacterium]
MKFAIFILFLLSMQITLAQSDRMNLSTKLLNDSIWPKAWSVEDTTQKKHYEMMALAMDSATFVMVYVDWTDALYMTNCTSSYKIEDNFIVTTILDCESNEELKYVYTYVTSYNEISVLMSDKRLPLNESLLLQDGWLNFQGFGPK